MSQEVDEGIVSKIDDAETDGTGICFLLLKRFFFTISI